MVLGMSGMLAAGLATTANAAAPAWQTLLALSNAGITSPDGNPITFDTVLATGANTGWGFPSGGTAAYERTGSAWKKVAFPAHSGRVLAAGASSPSDVWAVDNNNGNEEFLHWDGSAWSLVRSQETGAIVNAISVLGPRDVWAFSDTDHGAGVWHYDGTRWAYVSSTLHGGSALADNDVWAYSGSSVYHYDGATWTATSVAGVLPAFSSAQVTGILALAPDNVYAVGNGGSQTHGGAVVLLHYDGTRWSQVAASGHKGGQSLTSDGAGGVWLLAVGNNEELLHYTGGKLSVVDIVSTPASEPDYPTSMSLIPGGTSLLVGGGQNVTPDLSQTNAVVLQYGGGNTRSHA
jgi:hypothetical protein